MLKTINPWVKYIYIYITSTQVRYSQHVGISTTHLHSRSNASRQILHISMTTDTVRFLHTWQYPQHISTRDQTYVDEFLTSAWQQMWQHVQQDKFNILRWKDVRPGPLFLTSFSLGRSTRSLLKTRGWHPGWLLKSLTESPLANVHKLDAHNTVT